jgi:hypothetical protein
MKYYDFLQWKILKWYIYWTMHIFMCDCL